MQQTDFEKWTAEVFKNVKKPTKENPRYFWYGGYEFMNDGESFYFFKKEKWIECFLNFKKRIISYKKRNRIKKIYF